MSEPSNANPTGQALVPAGTHALALARRTSTAVGLTQLVQQEATAAYWFERGRAAEAAAQWPEAAHAYRQCIERDPDHWRGAVRQAAALAHLGEAEAAAAVLVETSEVTFVGKQTLAAELTESSWYQLRDCLEAARSVAEDGFKLLLGLAQVYRVLKQEEQARRTLDVMQFMYQRQVAGSAQWFRLSGNLYLGAELFIESVADYNRAIELKPDYASAYHNRGNAKMNLKDYAGAIIDCDRVIGLMPDTALAYRVRGNAQCGLENYAEAIADYSQAVELAQEDATSYYNRGRAKMSLKDYAGAVADYGRVIELKPKDASAYRMRGVAKVNLQDYTGAIADYDWAIRLKPDYAFAYNDWGNVKYNLQDYAGAIADYDCSIELKSDYALAYSNRAIAKGKLGDTAGAAADREKAAQLKASNEAS